MHQKPMFESQPQATLPEPTRIRWQPLRGGLMNIYRCDHEEFHYEQGHLLLKGNNGTGKSRILALQLPFLLDGDMAAHRVEPDKDPAKKMEWNLLMDRHDQRLGYTWLEFGIRDEQDRPHWATIGIGLSAAAGRSGVSSWFFLTRQRIGVDLFLQNIRGEPLTRPKLIQAIGECGEVFTEAHKYRRAVDAKFFNLGERRYDALINLLIELRQPQLSRKLDAKKLSDALSEALPPLGDNVIGDVAEAFRGLESDRDQLGELVAAKKGVDAFLQRYRRYLNIAARRRAAGVRTTHAAYEDTQRLLKASRETFTQAQQEQRQLRASLEALDLTIREQESRISTLETSPEMRAAHQLDASRRRAEELHRVTNQSLRDLSATEHQLEELNRRSQEAERRATLARADANAGTENALTHARVLGLEAPHQHALKPLALPELQFPDLLDQAQRDTEKQVGNRRRAAEQLRKLTRTIEAATRELKGAKEHADKVESQLTDATDKWRIRRQELARTIENTLERYRTWQESLVELPAPDLRTFDEAWREWAEEAEGRSPMVAAITDAHAQGLSNLARLRESLRTELASEAARKGELEAEREELITGFHHPPEAPYTRDAKSREGRPGAPLWLLCDFAPHVGVAHRIGLEAALEASGILDAWVLPDGRILQEDLHDTFFRTNTSPPEKNLDGILVPAENALDQNTARVGKDHIRNLLRRIGLGTCSQSAWVDPAGNWGNGILRGHWRKDVAEHIGTSVREARRQRKLAALESQLQACLGQIARLESQVDHLSQRERLMREEHQSAPSDKEIGEAHVRITEASDLVGRMRTLLAEAEQEVSRCRTVLDQANAQRDQSAADWQLTAWCGREHDLIDAIGNYKTSLVSLWPALKAFAEAKARLVQVHTDLEVEAMELDVRKQRSVQAEQDYSAAKVEFEELEKIAGVPAKEITARLSQAQAELKKTRAARIGADNQEREKEKEITRTEAELERHQENLARQTGERDLAIKRLVQFSEARLLAVTMPNLTHINPAASTKQAVELARRIENAASEAFDDGTWNRVSRDILGQTEELKSALLPYNFQPIPVNENGLFVVTIDFRGTTMGMSQFQEALAEDIQERETLLTHKERQVLEDHLIGEVAQHLRERLRDADKLVREMNQELASRPNSTGLTLRFEWQPDMQNGPEGLAAARKRLFGKVAAFSPADAEELGGFLQRHIQNVRTSEETTWQENLAKALDYRSWHQFIIERRQNGRWVPLTRRTHGTGSGGEKVIALTIPQFAAAAAHYRSADARAPRLILLDEAFVGVDSDMRAKCMGLLAAFDLDFIMTSEREWGCYATLPGVAIYQLSTRPGIEALGLVRWVWNGEETLKSNPTLTRATAPIGTADHD